MNERSNAPNEAQPGTTAAGELRYFSAASARQPARVLVLADTHMPSRARAFPAPVLAALQEANLIIHAGDFASLEVLDELQTFAPVVAVYGNVDPPEVRMRLPRRIIISVGRFRIGIVHGDGGPRTTIERAAQAFAFEDVDCIVFGHSHQPLCRREDDVLFLNPGSPTDKRHQSKYSFAWLHVGDTLDAEIVYF